MGIDELNEQIDVVSSSSGDLKGLGLAGSKKDRQRVVTLELTKKGFYYEDKQDLAYIREQQQKGNMIIVQGVISFTEEQTTPTIETYTGSNIDEVIAEVPKRYTAVFNNGIDFSEAVRGLNGFKKFNLALYDVTGAKFMTKTKSGRVKGFGLGNFYASPYSGGDGSTGAKQTVTFQIIDISEEDRQVYIGSNKLDYSPDELDDVNDITLNISPLFTGPSLTFQPLLNDKTTLVPNINPQNLRITVDGLPVVPSAISYLTTPGKVVATLPAPLANGDVVTMQTFAPTLGKNVILIDDILYKSGVETAIVPPAAP